MIFFLFFLVVLGTAVGEATVNKQQTSETGVEKLATPAAPTASGEATFCDNVQRCSSKSGHISSMLRNANPPDDALARSVAALIARGLYCTGVNNLAQGGTARASSKYSSASSASMGFAGTRKEWHSANGMPQWLMYELAVPTIICKITYLPRRVNSGGNTPRDCPSSYTVQGSNDGSDFEILLTVENQGPCTPGAEITKSFFNDKAFKFYRIEVTSVPGRTNGHHYAVIRDLRFFGDPSMMAHAIALLETHSGAIASIRSEIAKLKSDSLQCEAGAEFMRWEKTEHWRKKTMRIVFKRTFKSTPAVYIGVVGALSEIGKKVPPAFAVYNGTRITIHGLNIDMYAGINHQSETLIQVQYMACRPMN